LTDGTRRIRSECGGAGVVMVESGKGVRRHRRAPKLGMVQFWSRGILELRRIPEPLDLYRTASNRTKMCETNLGAEDYRNNI
jgi:hypothetical protein